ncbi:lipid-binding SYLF domain-containing protein [Acetobacteraceae bacterium KSS8]|uniref:Lipid-binding SYLF domain-containing protein n=1 Tax=Endosaccharibacter trunci TaxID=2812733 RepID=A0ABT1W8D0_9PROT|nr:lipid-binding SYLF domain-containing protein [Acetobacteraceae bacterium KSS8]
MAFVLGRSAMRSAALVMALAGLGGCVDSNIPTAERQQKQQALVDRATLTAQDVLDWHQNGGQAQRYLARAKAVMICPSIFRMGFLLAGSGGGCVMLARDGGGSWSAPAFYSMNSGSLGLQAGIQDAELMMFVMTRKGLTAMMDSQFKIGADASIAIATLGAGMEGATTAALRADIVAVEKAKGLFAGIALQGSMISSDSAGDRAYYGQPVGPEDILVAMRVNNQGADPLRSTLMRFGSATAAPAAGLPSASPDGYGATMPSNANGPMQIAPTGTVQQQSLPPPR